MQTNAMIEDLIRWNKFRIDIEQQIIQMQEHRTSLDSINPLIKIVRQREDLFFELLTFVNKNIQSSSNDLDQVTIFNKFIIHTKHRHQTFKQEELQFLSAFQEPNQATQRHVDDRNSKQILRLSSRIVELLEASITKVRKSIFDDNGRAGIEFTRFKSMLHKILKRDFVEYIINYSSNKYQRQIAKIEKYVFKIQQGEDIFFRQLYCKETSDVEVSPDQKKLKSDHKIDQKTVKKIEHLSSSEEPEKKVLKKTTKTLVKKKERLLNIKRMKEREDDEEEERPNKQQTATKLLKFYALMELHKREFLEDYVYEKMEEEKHKERIMSALIERNKLINVQINNFVKKSTSFIPVPLIVVNQKSSGEERNESLNSKMSLRTSFVISKRKASFHFESSSNNEKNSDVEKQLFESTVKNVNPRRRSSHSNHRPQEKSKKIFVVKAPMVFEDEMIPQAQVTQTQWLQAPLTIKGKERKNDNIRLKRRNNPNPLETTFLPETFRYPL